MSSQGFEPAIPVIKRVQTYALDRTATRIGKFKFDFFKIHLKIILKAVPYLRRLVAGLPLWGPEFDSRPLHMIFMVEEVALGQCLPRVLRFFFVTIIPPMCHTHLAIADRHVHKLCELQCH